VTLGGGLRAARSAVAAAVLIACAAVLWPYFWNAVPLEVSVVPRYLGMALALVVFVAATLGVGLRICEWLAPGPRRDGHTTVALATGMLVFGLAMAAAGHLKLYSAPLFHLLPAVFLVAGAGPLLDELRRFKEGLAKPVSYSASQLVLILVGVFAAALCIVPTFFPENVNYDARWYHLGIAEQYAVAGGIYPSPEGNHLVASPHLATWIYTWAFLEAPAQLFDKVLLASQLEVVSFVATLSLIPVAARLLRPPGNEDRLSLAWLAFFLFPAIYVYDTALMGGADRFAAFWATSSFVVWFWARAEQNWKLWVLLGAQLAATGLCKYTSILFLAPFGVVIFADAALTGWKRGLMRVSLQRVGIAAAVSVALAAPYWLRNLVFYGNPAYPLVHGLFGGEPWTVHTEAWRARYARELFIPTDGSLWWRIKATLLAVANHHVELYTWGDMTGGAPVFGSVFACMVLLLPFAGQVARLWLVVGITAAGIAFWFNLAHQMRYLLIFVPLMAASVAVLARLVWGWGLLARLGLVGLVGLQLLGSAEVPFFATHRMNGRRATIARVFDFLQRGQAERNDARYRVFSDWAELGARLPPRATLLVHNWGPVFGLNRRSVTDVPGIEEGLSYAELGTLPKIHARLRELGVTHVAWLSPSAQPDSVLGELLFRTFATRLTSGRFSHGAWTVVELGEDPPPDLGPSVMVLGCSPQYPAGLYPKEALAAPVVPMHELPEKSTPPEASSAEALARADAAVVLGGCPPGLDLAGFAHLGTNNSDQYYARPAKPLP
jgi:hypothetical protein